MLPPCRQGLRQPARLDGENDLVHLLAGKQHIQFAFDVGHVAVRHHVGRHRRLELRLSPKHHHRKEFLIRDAQEFLQRHYMLVVLVERILELELLAAGQRLRPLRTFLVAENPAGHILGFNDKDAEARHDDVIDLRRAVRRGQRDVVDVFVDVGIQEHLLGEGALELSRNAFEKRF